MKDSFLLFFKFSYEMMLGSVLVVPSMRVLVNISVLLVNLLGDREKDGRRVKHASTWERKRGRKMGN